MKRINENEREGWGETSNMYPIKTDLLTECTQYSEQRKKKKEIGCNVCVFWSGFVWAVLLLFCCVFFLAKAAHSQLHVK